MRGSHSGFGECTQDPNKDAGADRGVKSLAWKRAVLELLTRVGEKRRGVCLRETLERERPRRSSPQETSRSGIAYAAGMDLQGDGALPSGQRLALLGVLRGLKETGPVAGLRLA